MSLQYAAPAELTNGSCAQLLDSLDALLAQGDTTVDFSAVVQLDSSAVALLLEWRRRALHQRRELSFLALPAALLQLIRVYGVQELLQIKT
ncbi:lipid asymmetry maintenance protein MlaB [Chitinibacter sp. S2-10]|uniref:STAS domain-containing protein n=1 Tax=Chitinibacter sp. S2-10 TaxID=3373597 RepID=UPI003977969E